MGWQWTPNSTQQMSKFLGQRLLGLQLELQFLNKQGGAKAMEIAALNDAIHQITDRIATIAGLIVTDENGAPLFDEDGYVILPENN